MLILCINDKLWNHFTESYSHRTLPSIKKGKKYRVIEELNLKTNEIPGMGKGLHYMIKNEFGGKLWYFHTRFIFVTLNSNIVLL